MQNCTAEKWQMQCNCNDNGQTAEKEPGDYLLSLGQPAVSKVGNECQNDHAQDLIADLRIIICAVNQNLQEIAFNADKRQGRQQEFKIDTQTMNHNRNYIDEKDTDGRGDAACQHGAFAEDCASKNAKNGKNTKGARNRKK